MTALRLEWRVAWQAVVPSPNTALLSSYGGGVRIPPRPCCSWGHSGHGYLILLQG